MENSEWIDVRERLPNKRDAEWTGRVMVWHALNGCMLTGWYMVKDNRFVTHWRRLPEGPEGYREMHRSAIRGSDERFV